MPVDFYVGQPVDEVLKIATATRRKRREVEFSGEEGTFTLVEGQKPPKESEFDLSQDLTVKYFYDDCVLTFQRNRGPNETGALCYRVTEIENV